MSFLFFINLTGTEKMLNYDNLKLHSNDLYRALIE